MTPQSPDPVPIAETEPLGFGWSIDEPTQFPSEDGDGPAPEAAPPGPLVLLSFGLLALVLAVGAMVLGGTT